MIFGHAYDLSLKLEILICVRLLYLVEAAKELLLVV